MNRASLTGSRQRHQVHALFCQHITGSRHVRAMEPFARSAPGHHQPTASPSITDTRYVHLAQAYAMVCRDRTRAHRRSSSGNVQRLVTVQCHNGVGGSRRRVATAQVLAALAVMWRFILSCCWNMATGAGIECHQRAEESHMSQAAASTSASFTYH